LNKEKIGTTLAFFTAIISGFAIFANKIFIVNLDPTVFTALRSIIIGSIFFVLAIAKSNFKIGVMKKFSWKYLIIIGLIGGGLAFLLFFTGLKLTTSGRAAFLHKTLPLYITLLAFVFLREKITRKQQAALLLMLVGTCILYFSKIPPSQLWANPSLGDLLVISAVIFWAIENVIAKKVMRMKESNFVVSFGRMFFGSLFLFSAAIMLGKANLFLMITPEQFYNILFSTAILFGYVLFYYWSLKYINVSKASTILLISPVITLILGITFLSEPTTSMQLLGSAIILIGAYLISSVKSEFEARI
jgi:drug/metabolite transporter (DMT)-like permease